MDTSTQDKAHQENSGFSHIPLAQLYPYLEYFHKQCRFSVFLHLCK